MRRPELSESAALAEGLHEYSLGPILPYEDFFVDHDEEKNWYLYQESLTDSYDYTDWDSEWELDRQDELDGYDDYGYDYELDYDY